MKTPHFNNLVNLRIGLKSHGLLNEDGINSVKEFENIRALLNEIIIVDMFSTSKKKIKLYEKAELPHFYNLLSFYRDKASAFTKVSDTAETADKRAQCQLMYEELAMIRDKVVLPSTDKLKMKEQPLLKTKKYLVCSLTKLPKDFYKNKNPLLIIKEPSDEPFLFCIDDSEGQKNIHRANKCLNACLNLGDSPAEEINRLKNCEGKLILLEQKISALRNKVLSINEATEIANRLSDEVQDSLANEIHDLLETGL